MSILDTLSGIAGVLPAPIKTGIDLATAAVKTPEVQKVIPTETPTAANGPQPSVFGRLVDMARSAQTSETHQALTDKYANTTISTPPPVLNTEQRVQQFNQNYGNQPLSFDKLRAGLDVLFQSAQETGQNVQAKATEDATALNKEGNPVESVMARALGGVVGGPLESVGQGGQELLSSPQTGNYGGGAGHVFFGAMGATPYGAAFNSLMAQPVVADAWKQHVTPVLDTIKSSLPDQIQNNPTLKAAADSIIDLAPFLLLHEAVKAGSGILNADVKNPLKDTVPVDYKEPGTDTFKTINIPTDKKWWSDFKDKVHETINQIVSDTSGHLYKGDMSRPGIDTPAPLPDTRATSFIQGEGFNQDTVAREVYNIDKLPVISKGGSDRLVFDLGDNKVLKVAKTARGLSQNSSEGDGLVAGTVLPDVYSSGKNYVVAEKVDFSQKRDEINALTKYLSSQNVRDSHGRMDGGKLWNALNNAEEKFNIPGLTDLSNYDLLWNDLTAARNWGVSAVDGRIVHADGGTLNSNILKVDQSLKDEFAQIKDQNKSLQEKFKDMPANEKASVKSPYAFLGGDKKLTPQELYERDTKAQVDREVALEKIKGFSKEQINLFNTIKNTSKLKTFSSGDIETLRNSKIGKYVEKAIEAVREQKGDMSDEEALQFIKDLPTQKDLAPVKITQVQPVAAKAPSLSTIDEKNSLLATGASTTPSASFQKFLDQPKEDIPKIDTTTAEGRSLEIQAQQSHQSVDPEYFDKVSSLDNIVKNAPTNVKDKINLLDYIRTPENVLKKIGFSNEAKLLRKGYEDYVKELPKNLDVITKWSERVPAESNARIFNYLDGQPIDLNPTEKQVATEIQTWLKDWAKRLNLPEDKQISHYITHIFEAQLMGKEFDEDLAKIIANKLPGQVYDPFLLKRLGARGYKQDTWAALDAYVKRATRKVNMDPALEAIKNKAGGELETSNIEESQWKYLQRYMNQVNLRPTELDKLIDNSVKSVFGYRFGGRPVTAVTGLVRRMTSRGLLGLNVGSALRNLSQGANTYAVLGEKYTALGYSKLLNLKNHQELFDEGVLNNNFISDRILSATKKKMQKVDTILYSFQEMGERINRGAAYFGAKQKYINEHSKLINKETTVQVEDLEKKAKEYAKEVVRKTQFAFGAIDQPVALGGDIAKTFAQMQNYTIKQTEFLAGMLKDKNFVGLLRYAAAGLLFVYTIGQAFNMKPSELIPTVRFGLPPSLTVPNEFLKAVMNSPDAFGNIPTTGQKIAAISKALFGLVPAASQITKTAGAIDALINGGEVTTASGKVKFTMNSQSTADVIKALLFGVSNTESGQQYLNKMANGTSLESIRPAYDNIQKLKDSGKTDEAIDAYDKLTTGEQKLYQELKVQPTYDAVQKLKADGKDAEAIALYDTLTKKEQTAYKNLKASNEPTPESALSKRDTLGLVSDYAKAFIKDPGNAWEALTTSEQLGVVKGNLVGFQRMSLQESEAIKKSKMEAMGIPWSKAKDYQLDHIIPIVMGGDNSEKNLQVLTKAEDTANNDIENYLGNLLKDSKITKKEGATAMLDYKNGKITADEIKAQYK